MLGKEDILAVMDEAEEADDLYGDDTEAAVNGWFAANGIEYEALHDILLNTSKQMLAHAAEANAPMHLVIGAGLAYGVELGMRLERRAAEERNADA